MKSHKASETSLLMINLRKKSNVCVTLIIYLRHKNCDKCLSVNPVRFTYSGNSRLCSHARKYRILIPTAVPMLLFMCSTNEIKSIKEKFKTKNIYNLNKTCSNIRMWGLDINKSKWTTIKNILAENITENCKSDVWLTVHRNSVWIRKTN